MARSSLSASGGFAVSLSALAFALCLLACGSGEGGTPRNEPETGKSNAADALAQLEADGKLPRLDRSTSLPGADEDEDGVRDDVGEYVAELGDSAAQKAALLDLARTLAATLTVDVKDDAALAQVAQDVTRAIGCSFEAYGPEQVDAKVHQIRRMTFNTRKRFDAYAAYNAALDGSVMVLPEPGDCR